MPNATDERWPNLSTFLGGWFHQDFFEDYGSPEGTIAAFRNGEPRSIVEGVAKEARALADLTDDDDELRRTMLALGISYAPWREGWACGAWLKEVARQLEDTDLANPTTSRTAAP